MAPGSRKESPIAGSGAPADGPWAAAKEAVIDQVGAGKFGESGEDAGLATRNRLAELEKDGILKIELDKSMSALTLSGPSSRWANPANGGLASPTGRGRRFDERTYGSKPSGALPPCTKHKQCSCAEYYVPRNRRRALSRLAWPGHLFGFISLKTDASGNVTFAPRKGYEPGGSSLSVSARRHQLHTCARQPST